MNNTFELGRSIAQMVPFQRIPIRKEHQQREIFATNSVNILYDSSRQEQI